MPFARGPCRSPSESRVPHPASLSRVGQVKPSCCCVTRARRKLVFGNSAPKSNPPARARLLALTLFRSPWPRSSSPVGLSHRVAGCEWEQTGQDWRAHFQVQVLSLLVVSRVHLPARGRFHELVGRLSMAQVHVQASQQARAMPSIRFLPPPSGRVCGTKLASL